MANINLKKNEGAKSAEQLIQELNDIKDLWQEDQDSRAHKYAAADAAADIRKAVKGTAIEKEANRILNGDGSFLESVKSIIALLNKSEDNEDTHLVDLGLDPKFKDMIASVFGQMSDGYWENTPRMRGYWKFAHPIIKDNKLYLEIDNATGKPYGSGVIRNLWNGMSDTRVKQFLADKIKFLVKEEGLKWDRGNTHTTDYLSYSSNPYPVKDCYYAYEVLKGRNADKHPEYSEAYVGIKDGNEFPVNVEYIDVDDDWQGNSSPDIYKVTVNGESGETDAIDAEKECVGKVLKALGYSLKESKKSEAAGRLTSRFRLKDIPEEQAVGYFNLFDDHFQMAKCEYDWSGNSRGDDLIITVYDERVRPEDLRWLGRKFADELKDFTINIGG